MRRTWCEINCHQTGVRQGTKKLLQQRQRNQEGHMRARLPLELDREACGCRNRSNGFRNVRNLPAGGRQNLHGDVEVFAHALDMREQAAPDSIELSRSGKARVRAAFGALDPRFVPPVKVLRNARDAAFLHDADSPANRATHCESQQTVEPAGGAHPKRAAHSCLSSR